jgi:nanoRNase/pAp phosphatase (c-di-AMP/oligoRNAs hydrolase)
MVTSKNNIPEITFSIYTTRKDRDASVVAKAMGGGGHKGAAGFICSPIGLLDILHTACELSNGGKC